MCRIFIIGFISFFAFIGIASADSFEAEIKQAVELTKAGQPGAALDAMDRATTALWLRSPLTVRKAAFVTKPAEEIGEYDKHPDSIFSKEGDVRVYAELIGYDWEKIEGMYKINITVDVLLKNAKGKKIWSKKEFGKFQQSKDYQFKSFYINLRLGIKGVEAGKYTLEYTLIDNLRKQIAVISLPFEAR